MRSLELIAVAVATLSLTACLNATTVVKLKPDGSGTVEQTTLMNMAALKGMMNAMKVFTEEVIGKEKLVARDDLQVSFEELNDLMGMKQLDAIEQKYAGG